MNSSVHRMKIQVLSSTSVSDIDPADYPERHDIAVGSVKRVAHIGCSESTCMKIYNEVEGFKFYCHKCCTYHFESSFNSPRERLRRKHAYEATVRYKSEESYDLPEDFSHSIQPKGLAWLGMGGWTFEMINKYNIGWSEELNRVILPVYPEGYTARAVESWQKPKYMEKVPQGVVWESQTDTQSCYGAVVCEDILSAGRCGQFIKAYSLLGTSLDTSVLSVLAKYDKILLWLDPDAGGISGLKKMYRRLHLVCDNVKVIRSDKDPKLLTDEEIRRLLCN